MNLLYVYYVYYNIVYDKYTILIWKFFNIQVKKMINKVTLSTELQNFIITMSKYYMIFMLSLSENVLFIIILFKVNSVNNLYYIY